MDMKFKEGDWVRCVDDGNTSIIEVGKLYRVQRVRNGFIHVNDVVGMYPKRFEPWTPAVGDRVRMVKDGRSTTGAAGKLATIDSWGGRLIDDGHYLLKIDPPYEYSTMSFKKELTRATIDCFEPVVGEVPAASEAKFKAGDRVRYIGDNDTEFYTIGKDYDVLSESGEDWYTLTDNRDRGPHSWSVDALREQFIQAPTPTTTPLQIEAGRFYKTRDGRKVGPMRRDDDLAFSDHGFVWIGEGSLTWRDDGTYAFEEESRDDIVAIWQAEPANDSATTTQPDSRLSVTISADTSALDAEIDRVKRRLKKLAKRARKLGIALEFSDLQDAA